MKQKALSVIALITVFVPIVALLFWKPDAAYATALVIGCCIFAAISFLYALFLFLKMKIKDTRVKIALGINAVYVVGILITVVLPRLR
jgi:heme/copper-type cytochrome/quinol oxidase subunit 4